MNEIEIKIQLRKWLKIKWITIVVTHFRVSKHKKKEKIQKKNKINNNNEKRIPKRSDNGQKLVKEVKNTKIKIWQYSFDWWELCW